MGSLARRKHRRRIKRIPKGKKRDVTRAEYNALIEMLNERGRIMEEMQKTLDLQFRRMAQMQVEIDEVRGAWSKGRAKMPA